MPIPGRQRAIDAHSKLRISAPCKGRLGAYGSARLVRPLLRMLKSPLLRFLLLSLLFLDSSSSPAQAQATVEVIHNFTEAPGISSYGLTADGEGNLYGTTEIGGQNGYGTVFRVSPSGSVTHLYHFESDLHFKSRLLLASDGWLYGTSVTGGLQNRGTIYRVSKTGEFEMLYDFSAGNIQYPTGELIEVGPGQFYGVGPEKFPSSGSDPFPGMIYRFSASEGLEVLRYIETAKGGTPNGPLVRGNDGKLYGAAGQNLFRVSVDGLNFEILYTLPTPIERSYFDRTTKRPPLTLASDGKFYGITETGGTHGFGTFFSLTESGELNVLHHFESTLPSIISGLVEGPDGLLYGTSVSERFRISKNGAFELIPVPEIYRGIYQTANVVFVGAESFIITIGNGPNDNLRNGAIVKHSPTEGYQITCRFGTGDSYFGAIHYYGIPSRLHLASDGNLYASVSDGGVFGNGAIARIKPGQGVDFSLASESLSTRSLCSLGLTEGAAKTLYGVGSRNAILKVPLDGGPAAVRNLESEVEPQFPFVRGTDGNLYTIGRTGSNPYTYYISRLDEAEQSAKLTNLHTFNDSATDVPFSLAVGSSGALYGTGSRSIFRVSPDGGLAVLNVFPVGSMGFLTNVCEGPDGAYYGLAYRPEGSSRLRFVKVTAAGELVVLQNYPTTDTQSFVYGPLIRANDGNFYVPSPEGIIRVTPVGEISMVHPMPVGASWRTRLGLAGDGSIYGLSAIGGPSNVGQLFRIVLPPPTTPAKSTFATTIVNESGEFVGSVNVQVTGQGRVSGTITMFGKARRFKGTLDSNGNLISSVTSPTKLPSEIQLKLDLSANPPTLTAVVYTFPSTPAASGRSIVVTSRASSLPAGVTAGKRTLRFSLPQQDLSPKGYGWATGAVSRSGSVRLVGRLADGAPFTSGFKLQVDGTGLLQIPHLKPDGWAFGLLDFKSTSGAEPNGTVSCRTPGLGGAIENLQAYMAPYDAPSANERVLNYNEPILDASLTVSGADPLNAAFNILLGDKAVAIEPNDLKLSLSIERATGRFRGSFNPPQNTAKPIKFSGVFDQTAQQGFGFFSAEGFTGSVTLTPRPAPVESE